VAHRLERTSLDQRLDHPLVADRQRHLVEEAVEIHRLTPIFACGDDAVDYVVPDVADRGQAESYVGAHRREVGRRFVDVGRQDRNAHPPALVEVEGQLVLVVGH
jgi:hypothetical protein